MDQREKLAFIASHPLEWEAFVSAIHIATKAVEVEKESPSFPTSSAETVLWRNAAVALDKMHQAFRQIGKTILSEARRQADEK